MPLHLVINNGYSKFQRDTFENKDVIALTVLSSDRHGKNRECSSYNFIAEGLTISSLYNL
jgi:hypothetical protein